MAYLARVARLCISKRTVAALFVGCILVFIVLSTLLSSGYPKPIAGHRVDHRVDRQGKSPSVAASLHTPVNNAAKHEPIKDSENSAAKGQTSPSRGQSSSSKGQTSTSAGQSSSSKGQSSPTNVQSSSSKIQTSPDFAVKIDSSLVQHVREKQAVEAVTIPKLPKDADLTLFNRAVKGDDLKLLIALMDAFTGAMDKAHIPYFLYSGSLIGSWRHHGLIPWDDDVDFMLPHKLMPNIEEAVNKLKPQYVLSKRQKIRWKVYAGKSVKIKGSAASVDWSWPFLDLSFYDGNATHMWDLDVKSFPKYMFHKTDIFPLKKRPFEGRLLPSPNNVRAVLAQNYKNVDTSCGTGNYNHRTEQFVNYKKIQTVHCSYLYDRLPFVQRQDTIFNATVASGHGRDDDASQSNVGCEESLVMNSTVVSCCFMDTNPC